jgi:transposase
LILREQAQHSINYKSNVVSREAERLKSKVPLEITSDEISRTYAQGEEAVNTLVQSLVERINGLEARVEALENQLKKDSHNSSKSPSSDIFGKRTKSLREKSDRSSGGQPGHPGSTLDWRAEPDAINIHSPRICSDCGYSLENVTAIDRELRQVHDLPLIEIQVTEHQCETKSCPHCHHLNRGVFPDTVDHVVQYGPNLQGLMVYLLDLQLLPSARVCELLADVYGVEVSEGTLYNVRSRCSDALLEVESEIKAAILDSPVVHFDETGFRVKSKLWWLHVACTDGLTFYFVHTKRGKIAMDAMKILPQFKGIANHDGLKSYTQYEESKHSLCNAHHLRELRFIAERYEQVWATQMIALLVEMNEAVKAAKALEQVSLESSDLEAFERQYNDILQTGFAENPAIPLPANQVKPRGRPKQSPAKNLLDRLQSQSEEVLRFIHNFDVPFDNNQAERDLRMMKLNQKISGCFRSEQGAVSFCRTRSYMSTLRKQGINVLDALVQVFMGDPISPFPLPE